MYELKKDYKTSAKLEESGKWFSINHGAKLKIARSNNKKYNEHWRNSVLASSEDSPDMTDDEATKLVIDAVARFILKDWSGICENGKELKYTVELGIEYLNMKDFRNMVASYADNRKNFLEFDVEEKAKN